jgi:putative FmdB family regulatory protein
MPTYEYLCNTCSNKFDHFHGINESPVKDCPECGGSVKKLISGGSGFIMKGSHAKEMPACAGQGSCCSEGSCAMAEHCH